MMNFRCGHYNKDLSKRGGARLLDLIYSYQQHQQQQQILAGTVENPSSATAAGGFLAHEYQPAKQVANGDAGISNTSAISNIPQHNIEAEVTPRKANRNKLKKASFRNSNCKSCLLMFGFLSFNVSQHYFYFWISCLNLICSSASTQYGDSAQVD